MEALFFLLAFFLGLSLVGVKADWNFALACCLCFGLFVCLSVFLFFCFQSQKIRQLSEVASVACCLLAQYSKEGLLPYVASSGIVAHDPVHKKKGGVFKEIIPLAMPGCPA